MQLSCIASIAFKAGLSGAAGEVQISGSHGNVLGSAGGIVSAQKRHSGTFHRQLSGGIAETVIGRCPGSAQDQKRAAFYRNVIAHKAGCSVFLGLQHDICPGPICNNGNRSLGCQCRSHIRQNGKESEIDRFAAFLQYDAGIEIISGSSRNRDVGRSYSQNSFLGIIAAVAVCQVTVIKLLHQEGTILRNRRIDCNVHTQVCRIQPVITAESGSEHIAAHGDMFIECGERHGINAVDGFHRFRQLGSVSCKDCHLAVTRDCPEDRYLFLCLEHHFHGDVLALDKGRSFCVFKEGLYTGIGVCFQLQRKILCNGNCRIRSGFRKYSLIGTCIHDLISRDHGSFCCLPEKTQIPAIHFKVLTPHRLAQNHCVSQLLGMICAVGRNLFGNSGNA